LLRPNSLSVKERQVLDWYYANLEYACATDLKYLSMNNWDQDDPYEFQGQHLMLSDGYSSMLTPMADGLDVVLNVRVDCNFRFRTESVNTFGTCRRRLTISRERRLVLLSSQATTGSLLVMPAWLPYHSVS
jgi:lysine-specific histone demethylase 1